MICYQLPGTILLPDVADRWVIMAIVFVFTFLLPTLGTGVLYWFGHVDSLMLRERAQRPLPLLLGAFSFGMASIILHQPAIFDRLLSQVMTGMTLAVFLTFLFSLRWKISAHGVGVGGALGLLLLFHLTGPSGPTLWGLVLTVLLAGSVLSARLALGAHTPGEAWAGLSLGIGLVFGLSVGLWLSN
ncbi:hypothetical protein E5K00_21565 [Hymenobacter aquaticus]|uniref:Phosphatase PAP2 family protein n=1 Tax=Hymenobacter aquaticus TaxID=1867101 RepID=A0A4Z0PTF7_9BACT|nr:hypothetical protein [Hymenobacter aquaticus]TGE20586.1 hypothetical protein E5K00_21565 [Hymenobacter aquaticus]